MDPAAFLAARLDEDAAVARHTASLPPWSVSETNDGGTADVEPAEAPDGLWHGWVAGHIAGGDADHIARWDPARVLRQVAAGRAILAEHAPVYPTMYPEPSGQPTCAVCHAGGWDWDPEKWPCATVRALAAVWRDHPGYDPAWAG